ncbi:MAG: M48 family peptidase, partial [Myxococcales bacterium]
RVVITSAATTAVVAALVMTTRISVKVMLAWSTCAQMGFMLMQCGLGVWEMALLHLVAHSLYKAHAFLGAGGAVRRASLVQLTPQAARPGLTGLVCGMLLGMAMTVLGSFVHPVIVEPLFNDFRSMPAGEMRSSILSIAEREGVSLDDVLIADASRRTSTLNAYVSGFGGTRRVVVYDTLLTDAPRREVLLVIAHELGHARDHDVAIGTTLGAVGVLIGVGVLSLLLGSAGVRRRYDDVRAGDVAVVPLVLALSAVTALLTSPVQSTVSRAMEARADRTSLEVTHDEQAFVDLHRRLALRSLADPTPPAISQFWFGSHPTVLQRVGIARALAAEEGRTQ